MHKPLSVMAVVFFAESLKDLVRFLRRDDTTCEIRRQLGYSEVLQNVCSFLLNISFLVIITIFQ